MLIHEIVHFILSLVVGLVFAYIYKKWQLIVYSFLVGFFLDIDHLIDYFIYKKQFAFNLDQFLFGTYFDLTNKVYIFFHSYEYVLLFLLIAIIILANKKRIRNASANAAVLLTIAASMFLHLIYDETYYQPRLLTYSIIYRASHNFDLDFFGFTTKK